MTSSKGEWCEYCQENHTKDFSPILKAKKQAIEREFKESLKSTSVKKKKAKKDNKPKSNYLDPLIKGLNKRKLGLTQQVGEKSAKFNRTQLAGRVNVKTRQTHILAKRKTRRKHKKRKLDSGVEGKTPQKEVIHGEEKSGEDLNLPNTLENIAQQKEIENAEKIKQEQEKEVKEWEEKQIIQPFEDVLASIFNQNR